MRRQGIVATVAVIVAMSVLPVSAAESPCVTPPCFEASEDAPLRVGVAKADITWHVGNERLGPVLGPPPDSTASPSPSESPMQIGSGGGDPLTFPGIHTRVYAKALVVEGPEPLAIVRTDTTGISGDLYESVTQRLEHAIGVAPERVLLAATHSHTNNQGAFPHPVHGAAFRSSDPREKEFIAAQIAKAVIDAWSNLRPATFAVGTGKVTLPAFNRRSPRTNDLERLDPEFGILRFDDAETDEPIAVVMNYGLHPVMLVDKQPLVSSDFVGLAERDVERSFDDTGDAPMAIWMTGAVGDQEPVYVRTSYARAEWTGRIFAAEAARVLADLDPEPLTRARVMSKIIPLPEPGAPSPDDVGAGNPTPSPWQIGPRFPWTAAPLLIPSSVRLQAIEFATATQKALLLSWPGEPIRDIGVALKEAVGKRGFENAFVLGLANDWAGYWLTPAEYDRGQYERLLAFYGRTSANYVSRHLLDLADALATGDALEQVDLPPHAQADRVLTAAIAAAGIALEEELGDAHVPVPDESPEAYNTTPVETSGATPVRFDWRGGSPEVARNWIPEVSVQRNVGRSQKWKTVAREGAGEILLWERTVTPGDSRWTAVWQPLFDAPPGDYRFSIEGHRQSETGSVPYALVSDPFHVGPCDCLEPGLLTVDAEPGGGLRIRVPADYPDVDGSLRLLPKRVTTGFALVDVISNGNVVETLSLSFVSKIEDVEEIVRPTGQTFDITLLMPTELGAFEAVWTGSPDVEFVVGSIEDESGNTAGP